MVLHTPPSIITKLNEIFFSFIWGKCEKVKRATLIADIADGGANMTDVESLFDSIKAAWVARILNSDDTETWSNFAKYYLNRLGNNMFVLRLNFNTIDMFPKLRLLPRFYQEVILSFNKSKTVKAIENRDDLLNKPLWGERHLKYSNKGKLVTPYFESWIQSGLIKVCNLTYNDDGRLDQNYIHRVLSNKTNVFSQISIISKILYPYRHMLAGHKAVNDTDIVLYDFREESLNNVKSKLFYRNLVSQKVERPHQEKNWAAMLNINSFQGIYQRKIHDIHENKLKEFNFKLLQGILPCGTNLKKWRKKSCDLCKICKVQEDVRHMLYECSFAQGIWNDLGEFLQKNISFYTLVTGDNLTQPENVITTMIAFLIYKQWLLGSLNNRPLPVHGNITLLLHDIKFRNLVYKSLKWHTITDLLDKIILNYC